SGLYRVDYMVTQLGRHAIGHDHRAHTDGPARVPPPAILEGNKSVTRKQGPESRNTPPAFSLPLANDRDVDPELSELEKMLGRPLTVRLGPRNDPAHPRQPRSQRLLADALPRTESSSIGSAASVRRRRWRGAPRAASSLGGSQCRRCTSRSRRY